MEIKKELVNGATVITLSGAVNSDNAKQFEAAMEGEPAGNGITLDFANLDYISSAGLRVVLKGKKLCGALPFKVINCSTDVKSIFDVTGFSEIVDIECKARTISVEGCEKIGAGACGECFRIDDETIIKLYYPKVSREEIETEKALAKKAFVMGVPTAISYDIVECDGRTGVVYELIKSKTLSELMREDPDNLDKYLKMYADVCKHIHSIKSTDEDLPKFKDINYADIKNVTGITEEERDYLYKFLEIVPVDNTCIHGDLNINNIMVQGDECCLIDMGEFSTGIAMYDVSRILFSMYYANQGGEEFNSFYKMPSKTVDDILNKFLLLYFEVDDINEAEAKNPSYKWLHPLAWFRTVTCLLKFDRWPEEKRQYALSLLRENLIPFIKENS